MRMMRRVLACVLSLGVAVQGYASVRAMDAGCPMRQAAAGMHAMHQMHGMEMDMDHSTAPDATGAPAQHEDCDDAGAAATHCGCVTGCQPASSSLVLPLLPAALWRVPQAPVADTPSFRSHHCFRHWRPPART